MDHYEFLSRSSSETITVGERLGRCLKGGEVILLTGNLGAGKTVFVKGIAKTLGVDARTPVVSPSFTLVNVYKARLDIVHVDLYRLDVNELWSLGLEDYMDDNHIIIVEWGDGARGYFGSAVIEVDIQYIEEQTRKIHIKGDIKGFNE